MTARLVWAMAAISAVLGHGALAGSDLATMTGGAAANAVNTQPSGGTAAEKAVPDWRSFADRFVTPEGRVVDDDNGGISHSEGQGYAMLLAEAAGDRAAFDRIWRWTRANLFIRPDGLAAWRWQPDATGTGGAVSDPNGAADGDILIAWALLRASERWNLPAHRGEAERLVRAIRANLVVEHAGLHVVLAGQEGFRRPEGLVVNPSYWVYPALLDFDRLHPGDDWDKVVRSGLVLLGRARFSPAELPGDWVLLASDGSVGLPSDMPHEYGYNAVRIPLYLAWAGYDDAYLLAPYLALAETRLGQAFIPATVGLPNGVPADYPADQGMVAIYRLAEHAAGYTSSGSASTAVASDAASSATGYYPTVLRLLAGLALKEGT